MTLRILYLSSHARSFMDPGFSHYIEGIKPLHPLEMKRCKTLRKLLESLKKTQGKVVALSRKGKLMDNETWLRFVQKHLSTPPHTLTFVVGGAEGLPEEVFQRSSAILSFSPLTIAHELFLCLLLEQIYRALTRMHGLRYHKG